MSEHDLVTNWDSKAADWDKQVGEHGDMNRRLNSDPVLWELLGDVRQKSILDAGCGTGYLCRQLMRKGARVTGIDISPEMIKIAAQKAAQHELGMALKVECASELTTQKDQYFDAVIANYVLMDLPDMQGAVKNFYRVLKSGGTAIIVLTHPCFPLGLTLEDHEPVAYQWPFPYFEKREVTEDPWKHFKTPFTWYHRPLSAYWSSFQQAGFQILDFREPYGQLSGNDEQTRTYNYQLRSRPNSVVFHLLRP